MALSIDVRWGRGKTKIFNRKGRGEQPRRTLRSGCAITPPELAKCIGAPRQILRPFGLRMTSIFVWYVLLDGFGDGAALFAQLDLEGFYRERGFGLE